MVDSMVDQLHSLHQGLIAMAQDVDIEAWFMHLAKLCVASRVVARKGGDMLSLHEYIEDHSTPEMVLDALVIAVAQYADAMEDIYGKRGMEDGR